MPSIYSENIVTNAKGSTGTYYKHWMQIPVRLLKTMAEAKELFNDILIQSIVNNIFVFFFVKGGSILRKKYVLFVSVPRFLCTKEAFGYFKSWN